jgi:hypothetical protein
MRVIVSLLAAIAAGLAVILSIPTYLLLKQNSANSTGLLFVALLDLVNTAPIWLPLAPIVAACVYYACHASLSPRKETSQADRAGIFLGWKISRATIIMYLVMAAFVFALFGEFAYRKNYACGPGEQIIQSDADAIKQAQRQFFKARFHDISGYIDGTPGVADFSQPDCCKVKRALTWTGVIEWEVTLEGETIGEPKKRRVSALTTLSNCGAIFDEDSYVSVYPIK